MAGMCGFLRVSPPSALLGAWHLVYRWEALPGIFQGLLFVCVLLAKVQPKHLKTFHISFDLKMTQIKVLFSSNQIKALFFSNQIKVYFLLIKSRFYFLLIILCYLQGYSAEKKYKILLATSAFQPTCDSDG